MVLAGDFEKGGESSCVCIDSVTDSFSNLLCISTKLPHISEKSYMLVYEQNANVLPLRCEFLECFFDSCVIRLAVDNKEVLLRVWRLSDMLPSVRINWPILLSYRVPTPMPANSRPVTESCPPARLASVDINHQ